MGHRNPDDARAYHAAWRARNKEKLRADGVAYRAANAERLKVEKLAWQRAHPEKRKQHRATERAKDPTAFKQRDRRSHLRTTYGLADGEYEALLDKQGGVCAICRKPPTLGKQLWVDHDHASGEVRGLLHAKCNTAIGLLCDDPQLLQAAREYLLAYIGKAAGATQIPTCLAG